MAGGSPNEIYSPRYDIFTVSYSDVQQNSGVYTGTGNINVDPMFVKSEEGNYYLQAGSPCIDKGISTHRWQPFPGHLNFKLRVIRFNSLMLLSLILIPLFHGCGILGMEE